MPITRGTTPTIEITIAELDISQVELMKVTFSQHRELYTKSSREGEIQTEGQTLHIPLSEKETLQMKTGQPLKIQVRGTFKDGGRWATNIMTDDVLPIILEGEIDP